MIMREREKKKNLANLSEFRIAFSALPSPSVVKEK